MLNDSHRGHDSSKEKEKKVTSLSHVQPFETPRTYQGLPELTRLLHPWDFPGKITEVGCHFLLQEIFPTQGLNLGPPAL